MSGGDFVRLVLVLLWRYFSGSGMLVLGEQGLVEKKRRQAKRRIKAILERNKVRREKVITKNDEIGRLVADHKRR